MKKNVSVLLIFVLLFAAMFALSSCNKDDDEGALSGTYTVIQKMNGREVENTYIFEGKNFTAINKQGDYYNQTIKGTYKVDGEKIIFFYELGGEAEELECAFEEGEGYIKIDGVKLDKQ